MKPYRLAGRLLTLLILVIILGPARARGPSLSATASQSPDASITIGATQPGNLINARRVRLETIRR